MKAETKEWLDFAEMDHGVAKHLMASFHPRPIEIICFHCQQAAEKAIKALIVENGAQGGLPKLHDLSFLLNQVKNMVRIDAQYYDHADELTPYGVALRYPHELFLDERHATRAIQCAGEILDWVKREIGGREASA